MAFKIILVAPMVKSVPSSILLFSRGLSSILSTKVPVLLLLLNYYDTSTVRIDGLGWGVDTDAKLFTTFVTLKNK